jgi:hypothetical protein
MADLFGFDRFGQHTQWRCSGRVEGSDVEENEPPLFIIERQGDRWALTNAHVIAVGDASRDLVTADGGLVRYPATLGFLSYFSAGMARRIGLFSHITEWDVLSSRESEHAGRPALDLELTDGEYQLSVGVDAETGVWTWSHNAGLTVAVDELTIEPEAAPAFVLLDLVPDIDLSHREPVAKALSPILSALEEASGLQGEVLYQDEETGEFTFLLCDDSQPQALVDRTHAESSPRRAVFAGVQHRWETEDWTYAVDTTAPDHLWSRPIVKALERL